MSDPTGSREGTEPAPPVDEGVPSPEEAPTRAGYVALVGPPNAGKSTLLNALLGTKLSIVTPRAQTTWRRVTGIHTADGVQMVFLDTPGLLEARDLLQRSMLEDAVGALHDADVVLLVLDAARDLDPARRSAVRDALSRTSAPVIAALNKVDLAEPSRVAALATWAETELGARPLAVSALEGRGVEEIRDALTQRLPLSPFFYPTEDLASQPVRFFVAELIRETVFELYQEEIPYSAFCQIGEFREDQTPIYVQATIYVERASQKGIIIGERGSGIRRLGTAARAKVEHFLGAPVYLDLWVKALPGWRRKRGHLARFGFRVPEDHDPSR